MGKEAAGAEAEAEMATEAAAMATEAAATEAERAVARVVAENGGRGAWAAAAAA